MLVKISALARISSPRICLSPTEGIFSVKVSANVSVCSSNLLLLQIHYNTVTDMDEMITQLDGACLRRPYKTVMQNGTKKCMSLWTQPH